MKDKTKTRTRYLAKQTGLALDQLRLAVGKSNQDRDMAAKGVLNLERLLDRMKENAILVDGAIKTLEGVQEALEED